VFALVFLAGVVGSLSPCVYPLIPITISLFGARSANSRMQGFLLSLVYVLGIAVTYSALGVLAATSGGLFGSALQSRLGRRDRGRQFSWRWACPCSASSRFACRMP
jgi:thiol:disulfide interchange protein DsbD